MKHAQVARGRHTDTALQRALQGIVDESVHIESGNGLRLAALLTCLQPQICFETPRVNQCGRNGYRGYAKLGT